MGNSMSKDTLSSSGAPADILRLKKYQLKGRLLQSVLSTSAMVIDRIFKIDLTEKESDEEAAASDFVGGVGRSGRFRRLDRRRAGWPWFLYREDQYAD